MKFIFLSDKFSYIHPSMTPRRSSEYSTEDLKIAADNTSKVKYDKDLLSKARSSSTNPLPSSQIGSMIIFPEIEGDTELLKELVRDTFISVMTKLQSEYKDERDPINFYSLKDDGSLFGATYHNKIKRSKAIFSPKSVALYIAGCKENTANYIFEELIDNCYIETEKHDKKITKNGGKETEKYNFDKLNTFLIYSFSSQRFHQIGAKESELYFDSRRLSN